MFTEKQFFAVKLMRKMNISNFESFSVIIINAGLTFLSK